MATLELLLSHVDDGTPVLRDGLPEDSVRLAPKPDDGRVDTPRRGDTSADPNDLAAQGWGLVVPEGKAGERILAALGPLISQREDQQGRPVVVYRVPPGLTGRQAMQWRNEVYAPLSVADSERPFYLLFLGDLDQVSLRLQQVLPPECFSGRLAFTTLEDYEAYANKVVAHERLARDSDPRFLCYTAHDGTRATMTGYEVLVKPGLALARKERDEGRLRVEQVQELGDPFLLDPGELLETASVGQRDLLFSLCHGAGAPKKGWRSYKEQRLRQGAMMFGDSGTIQAEDLRGVPFMEGGIWFHLSCFGAGTPVRSSYYHWLKRLVQVEDVGIVAEAVLQSMPADGAPGFIAALPQVALANERGPLAFIGHMDLAWSYSFQDLEGGSRATRFLAIWQALAAGRRVGVALGRLASDFLEANFHLANDYDSEREARSWGTPYQADSAYRAHLWLKRQDLGGFLLLGDPAARLPPLEPSPDEREVPPVVTWGRATIESPASSPPRGAPATSSHTSDDGRLGVIVPVEETSGVRAWHGAIADRIAAGATVRIEEQYEGVGEAHHLVRRTIHIGDPPRSA